MQRSLVEFSQTQQQRVIMAKAKCAEITSQHKASQAAQQQAAMAPHIQRVMMVQETAQRQRAFQLMCRVYVGSISFDMREDQVRQAFVPFGPIKSIDLAWDNVTMKHKGFAFVEYECPEAAQLALDQMNGAMLGGRNIKCGRPSSMPAAAPVIAQLTAEAEAYSRIYVGSVHNDLSENDLRSVFEAFGKITALQLAPDAMPGRHRGFAFVEFETKQSCVDATQAMNLFDLGGQYLRVRSAMTAPVPIGASAGMPFLPPASATPSVNPAMAANTAPLVAAQIQSQIGANSGPTLSGLGGMGLGAAGLSAGLVGGSTLASAGALSGGGGLGGLQAQIQMQQAAQLQQMSQLQQVAQLAQMQALNGTDPATAAAVAAAATSAAASAAGPAPVVATTAGVGAPAQALTESCVVMLRNMVLPEELDEELEGEVQDECSRYGSVRRVVVHTQEINGETAVKIFVCFTEPSEAEKARQSLAGRLFAGRTVHAEIFDQSRFDAGQLNG